MTTFQRYGFFISFLILALTVGCSPVKPLQVWKDEAYTKRLEKVLVIAVAEQSYIRSQFETVLANQLVSRGAEAIPSHKVLPQPGEELDRLTVLEKVRELGVNNVLVARSINRESVVNYQPGGGSFAATAINSDGWFTYYVGSIGLRDKEYDTDYYTIAINLFDVQSKNPVWSSLSQVKVAGSKQDVVNLFIPTIVKQLEESQFLE